MPFVQHALAQLAPGGVLIFLLRLALLESQGRRLFWAAHPPARVAVCVPRPSFTADGHTDATAYAIYQWIRGAAGPPRLEWLDWSASPAAPATPEPARQAALALAYPQSRRFNARPRTATPPGRRPGLHTNL